MTSSSDFLVDHAYKNVWCTPGQDRQYIIGPQRTSKRQGEIGSVKIGMRHYTLPTKGEWYHMFTIGELSPATLGMAPIVDKWVSAQAHCNSTSLLIYAYLNNGKHIPIHRIYFLYTHFGALVVAIKDTKEVAHFGVEQPFLRWRSNAWFDGQNGVGVNKGVEVNGIKIDTVDQFSQFQVKWRAAKQKPGYAWAHVNGLRVKDLNPTTAKVGDVIEYYYDASVREVMEITVKTLRSFISRMDNLAKYFLPRPGLGTTIDYVDDVDIYILNYKLAAAYTGLYYHQNQPTAIRNVTHRDFSIPSSFLRGYVDNASGWIWNDDLRLELIIRNSGYDRHLIDEEHRIKELFKLPEANRLNVMIGEDAGVPVWKAAELEDSYYPKLMRARDFSITKSMVEKAYGYNAISKLIGDTPQRLEVSGEWVKLPYGAVTRSTVYEYDKDGVMIGWYQHDYSIEYPIRNPTVTKYIEAYSGKGCVGLGTDYDKPTTKMAVGTEYRFYVCDIWNGVSRNNWRDVTGNTAYYTVANGVATWVIDRSKYHTAVRDDAHFLAKDLELNYRDDLLAFTVTAEEVMSGRVPVVDVMSVPPMQFDLLINGMTLVENIDYYVEWPQVCIVCKPHLKEGIQQKVHLRGRGFCGPEMERDTPLDYGFVMHQRLSYNGRYNVRDDKVCKISIGGQLYTRDEVATAEDGTLFGNDLRNGAPYQIVHPIIPLLGTTDTDTYTLRERSMEIDAEVEGYLSLHIPQPEEPQPSPQAGWYSVYSPFAAKIMYDMLYGVIQMDEFKGEYSLEFVRERLKGYDWILPYDPALKNVDKDFITIHPHPEVGPVKLNIYQYRLLDRAIEVFLGGNVLMNRHLVIVEEGYEHEMDDHPHPHRSWDEVEA